ncbi:tetracycline resistance MFS efflux pump [Phaeobacter gallaeciensis]|uniref:Tetracycline resistance protein, class C n=1 Tax=Phaeobacter gallaeciensis TaxID=60890 RepID=A0AAC9Z9K9_9RHOB|nr:tetracycline resistance MFS efflux pump [Phaeobacter gallaeciensis]AHD09850.1 Arabinose efflux permease [Phaeobacter gallaeciensis DSM 26640]ATE93114.1 putative tetracycline resistance protein, class C [Phaeobacter gallaeciensis]ATE97064.1 putative tetracycline resistance protein, class C [Phaeobacter gallaeciensis]ATF01779.1 putative tetracycline resistance protein, class C [Phaeobacter gallaeciensis]ATF06159.1 putative tetracycline resistance protein, class C [Phaeobacter gallaeciensis]
MKLTGPFLFILATLMIDAIGVGIVFPIMPDLMLRVGAQSTAEGALWSGIMMSAYAAAMFLFGPIVGSLSDSYGRRPVLILALVTLTIDYVIMALAQTYWMLLVGRVIAGMAGATYITATAYISDIAKPTERSAAFGMIGAAFGIGFVLGPALGGLASGLHISAPFWIAAGLSALNVVFGIVILPESLKPENRRPFGKRDLNPFGTLIRAFVIPGLAIPLICIFVFEFANLVYPTLWSFWGREVFGWDGFTIGVTLSAYGVLIAAVQAGILPQMTKRLGDFKTLIIAMVAAVIAMVGFGFASAIWVVVVFLPIAALSDMAPPLITAFAANRVGEDQQGVVQGVIASLSSVAAVVAPLVLTGVFERFVGEAEWYLPGAPFLVAAVLVLALAPLVLRLRDHDSRSSN